MHLTLIYLLNFYCSDQLESDLHQGDSAENIYTRPFQIDKSKESAPSLIGLSGCSLDRARYELIAKRPI